MWSLFTVSILTATTAFPFVSSMRITQFCHNYDPNLFLIHKTMNNTVKMYSKIVLQSRRQCLKLFYFEDHNCAGQPSNLKCFLMCVAAQFRRAHRSHVDSGIVYLLAQHNFPRGFRAMFFGIPGGRQTQTMSDRLTCCAGKVLGSGAFGIVKKGEANSICRKRVVTTVAVKMVRANHSLDHMMALQRELKILAHLGKHLNIVNLLGACTTRISYGELFVIVEFCRFGNLHDYLLRRRDYFVDQIDAATGTIAVSGSQSNFIEANDSGINTLGLDTISASGNCDQSSDTVTIDNPASEDDYVTPDEVSPYQGDFEDQDLKPISTRDLLSWAWQVSRGMKYLTSRKVVHGDLAARNILLADNKVVKICDFGLAKSLYSDDIYKKEGQGPLPIKWMAIESIRDRVFSVKSDVWSFGVVLWEFFTLAETPYPGINNESVYRKLVKGHRMERPKYATDDIYNMMLCSWNNDPAARPSFAELEETIEHFLEEKIRTDYLVLDAPYAELNAKELASGQTDYLTMKPSEYPSDSAEPTVTPSEIEQRNRSVVSAEAV